VDKDRDRDKEKEKNKSLDSISPPPISEARAQEMDELLRRLQPELSRAKPDPVALSAALEAVRHLAAEDDTERSADDVASALAREESGEPCGVCGQPNRPGNKFCGRCGVGISGSDQAEPQFQPGLLRDDAIALTDPFANSHADEAMNGRRPAASDRHYYHHHYHHHYFPGGFNGGTPRASGEPAREGARDPDRLRPTAAFRGDMSRAEAAVRRLTQEWVLACNTKHLDDLLDLYLADALVLRSNHPVVRGAAAVREFFFGALDSGLGEVEVEPLRVEIAGDMAFEAGRCKALVPGATGKRREERGKYLWVCSRQPTGEWKLAADIWSSDLTLTTLESDIPAGAGVKSSHPRKSS
jgi:ketosteroid isomerase-like protein